jgi:diguanylate cyclase (GGDEF)-like protein
MTSRTILAVSDNPLTLKEARAALERVGYAVVEAQDRRSALQMMATHAPDLILQDRLLLEHRALHDALTDLPNRALLQDRMEQAIRVAQRSHTCLSLLLLDLDRFKDINDTFGHHAGDLLLQQVAARLRSALRAMDTVARLGGDEFAVLLSGGDDDGTRVAAHKICAALEAPVTIEGHDLRVMASIGIALYPAHGTDFPTLLRHADVAMYAAKRQHSAYAVYDAAQDPHSPSRVALIGDLHHAVNRGALVLHYQPTVDLSTGRLSGTEALTRWPHPTDGLIAPDRFIPLAEQTGLIAPLSAWALETAVRQCRDWRRTGLDLGVAVNLSMWNLLDPQLPQTIAHLLQRYGVPAAALRLELTESALMADPARVLDVLTRLAGIGVTLAVDDFGTGYSSLAYLKRLPVDELKIDKSFVLHMAEDEADAAIVRSTIGLGHSLGLQVVAEGVENGETQQQLAAMGCDAIQGYYCSRPLPADELTRWLRETPGAVPATGS